MTAKLIKLKEAPGIWSGKQVRREWVLFVATSKDEVDQICQALAGIRDENDRRRKNAFDALASATVAADAACDKQMAVLLACLNKEQAA